jgi:hypothetical protein
VGVAPDAQGSDPISTNGVTLSVHQPKQDAEAVAATVSPQNDVEESNTLQETVEFSISRAQQSAVERLQDAPGADDWLMNSARQRSSLQQHQDCTLSAAGQGVHSQTQSLIHVSSSSSLHHFYCCPETPDSFSSALSLEQTPARIKLPQNSDLALV